jgi:hypothetical protein
MMRCALYARVPCTDQPPQGRLQMKTSPMCWTLVTLALTTTLAVNAWAGDVVTLAENQTFPAATNPAACLVHEFDPVPMKKFTHVTFVGKGPTPPAQASILYLFSLEPVTFSVPAPSGTLIGGQCFLQRFSPDIFPLDNQVECAGGYQGSGHYVVVALFSCSPVPITVTLKAYLF